MSKSRQGKAFYYSAARVKRDEYIARVGMWPERERDEASEEYEGEIARDDPCNEVYE